MHKLVIIAFAVLTTMQVLPTTEAFIVKTVSIEKAYPGSSADAAAAAVTASKNALVQTVTNAVTEKINTLTSLLNSIVQAKVQAKTDLWRTASNVGGDIVKSVNGFIANAPVYRKTITFGFKKPVYVTTTTKQAPTTTATGATVPTTTSTTTGQSGGYARYVRYVRTN